MDNRDKPRRTSRRRLLKTVGSASLLAGVAPAIIAGRARAQQKTLRVMRWKNFVPGFEVWFNETFVKEWGEENDTQVVVDNVGLGEINGLAASEAAAQQGHDLVLFLTPRPALEDFVIDHRDVVEECQRLYGDPYDFITRSSFNPRTQRYHGFCESYAPSALTYRKDLWDAVGKTPDTWDDVRTGGRAVKLLHETPTGISLTAEHNGEHSLRAILYAFGGSVQDGDSNVALASAATLEAIKFTKALFEEAMTPEVLEWNPSSNNRYMLAGSGGLTLDTMSIIRAAQNTELPVNPHLSLALLPEGPGGRFGPMFAVNTYTIWRFAENIPGAKKFLIDYIGRFKEGFLASGFQNMPSFPGSVPGLTDHLTNDNTGPAGRYSVLVDVPGTITSLGFPGYANAATDEVMNSGIVARMFSRAATGAMTPADSQDQAVRETAPIFEKWRSSGKI